MNISERRESSVGESLGQDEIHHLVKQNEYERSGIERKHKVQYIESRNKQFVSSGDLLNDVILYMNSRANQVSKKHRDKILKMMHLDLPAHITDIKGTPYDLKGKINPKDSALNAAIKNVKKQCLVDTSLSLIDDAIRLVTDKPLIPIDQVGEILFDAEIVSRPINWITLTSICRIMGREKQIDNISICGIRYAIKYEHKRLIEKTVTKIRKKRERLIKESLRTGNAIEHSLDIDDYRDLVLYNVTDADGMAKSIWHAYDNYITSYMNLRQATSNN